MTLASDLTSRHFDSESNGYYQRNYERPRNRHERGLALRRAICLELLPSEHRRVLDLGCGPGALALPLIEADREVYAMDLSPRMVGSARQLATTHAPERRAGFCVGDATQLPFADETFDAVVSAGMLEYVPAPERVLAEVAPRDPLGGAARRAAARPAGWPVALPPAVHARPA
jgi:SAM-dependent methyltransferase